MNEMIMIQHLVNKEIKEQAEAIFEKLGLTIEQAINLFLKETILHSGLPFEVIIPTKEEQEDINFATAVATVDGNPSPSERTKRLMILYKRGIIDLETAKFAIERMYKC